MSRLVIRCAFGQYYLCTGKPPCAIEPEKDGLYVGEVVGCFRTWEEANEVRGVIESVYGNEE